MRVRSKKFPRIRRRKEFGVVRFENRSGRLGRVVPSSFLPVFPPDVFPLFRRKYKCCYPCNRRQDAFRFPCHSRFYFSLCVIIKRTQQTTRGPSAGESSCRLGARAIEAGVLRPAREFRRTDCSPPPSRRVRRNGAAPRNRENASPYLKDKIEVDGREVLAAEKVYWMFE